MTTLPHSCAVVMKSGNLNFLEPSGPLLACKGTSLPRPLPKCITSFYTLSFPPISQIHKRNYVLMFYLYVN